MFGVVGEHEGSEECSACGYSCGDETSGVESLKEAGAGHGQQVVGRVAGCAGGGEPVGGEVGGTDAVAGGVMAGLGTPGSRLACTWWM